MERTLLSENLLEELKVIEHTISEVVKKCDLSIAKCRDLIYGTTVALIEMCLLIFILWLLTRRLKSKEENIDVLNGFRIQEDFDYIKWVIDKRYESYQRKVKSLYAILRTHVLFICIASIAISSTKLKLLKLWV